MEGYPREGGGVFLRGTAVLRIEARAGPCLLRGIFQRFLRVGSILAGRIESV